MPGLLDDAVPERRPNVPARLLTRREYRADNKSNSCVSLGVIDFCESQGAAKYRKLPSAERASTCRWKAAVGHSHVCASFRPPPACRRAADRPGTEVGGVFCGTGTASRAAPQLEVLIYRL